MTIALLFLMTHHILGDAFHEWVGTAMLILFLLHYALNARWSRTAVRTAMLRVLAVLVAAYGTVCFVRRDIGSYMTLQTQFVFFDYGEPFVFLFANYLAIMGLFVFLGHYLASAVRSISGGKRKKIYFREICWFSLPENYGCKYA